MFHRTTEELILTPWHDHQANRTIIPLWPIRQLGLWDAVSKSASCVLEYRRF